MALAGEDVRLPPAALRSDWAGRFSTEEIETLVVPKRTLARRMVEVTGLSANNFLGRMRLCQAMRLLANTTDPITDIAFACGFNDSNYFSSRFHQEIGITPSQFRQQKNCYAPHFKIAGTLN